jgi:orotate phosphoribosyltransferase
LLFESGALVEGHFVYASGRHGSLYVNKTAGLVLASHACEFAVRIVRHFAKSGIEAVVAPELGAVVLGANVARELYKAGVRDIACIVAEKERVEGKPTGKFFIGRDQARFLKGRRALVVEDILTTGDSARETVHAARAAGGDPVAAAALWNRGGISAEHLDVPELWAIVNEKLEDWPAEQCPLCRRGVPVNTDFGKGAQFLTHKASAA